MTPETLTRAGTSQAPPEPGAAAAHACWADGAFCLWAEDALQAFYTLTRPGGDAGASLHDPGESSAPSPLHPFALDGERLKALIEPCLGSAALSDQSRRRLVLRLPRVGDAPAPSPHAAHMAGLAALDLASAVEPSLGAWAVEAVALDGAQTVAFLDGLTDVGLPPELFAGRDLRFYAAAGRLARALVAEGRVVPMLVREEDGSVRARWHAWLRDESVRERLGALLATQPPVARSAIGAPGASAWSLLEDFLHMLVDARCRQALGRERLVDALAGRDSADPHVAWLTGLLDGEDAIPARGDAADRLISGARRWLGRLEDCGEDTAWRLLLRVQAPDLDVFDAEPSKATWRIEFFLEPRDRTGRPTPAGDIWRLPLDGAFLDGRRIDQPHDLLLAELDRASRLCPLLEPAMRREHPERVEISAAEAQRFLREDRPLLLEQGVGVNPPDWWGGADARLGARARIEPIVSPIAGGDGATPGSTEGLSPAPEGFLEGKGSGLERMVRLEWRLAIGDAPVSTEALERWARDGSPFVRFADRWIELLPEDIEAARELLKLGESREMPLREAIGVSLGVGPKAAKLPIVGMEAGDWLQELLAHAPGVGAPRAVQPEAFHGELRAYQVAGLSWLAFLEAHGLGGCLADDMGLGKTIQIIALLLREREVGGAASVAPTLLIVPTSVVSNWLREMRRFAPDLKTMAHHGPERARGDAFLERIQGLDAVVTTYALAHRDVEDLAQIRWRRVVLDEAQKIKNPDAKQTHAVRAIPAQTRLALTGTPVENHLTDLWSIMHFCNPGLLGPLESFRRNIAAPIERDRNEARRRRLRGVIQPFLLRRVKTDPAIEIDLPEKIETREHCSLTLEQASLYERAVEETLSGVDAAAGVRRRGLILAGLTRLKQICNHPAQALGDPVASAGVDPRFAQRSGKCLRLLEMLEEILEEGDQAIIFSQFRVMAEMLAALLRRRLDREALLLHGGTPREQRQRIVDRFQSRDGSASMLILSLKAGGLGMNLTAANHVFHFDRWWNPAVESQATDRAHRIGQTRTVHVHKFVVAGTLEDRIDEMLEEKKDLAARVVGAGEQWITELSTEQLREVLALRRETIESASASDAVDDAA